ncbi:MAG TPA: Rap1a/Tai family immunity protein [Candidatus Dormibacteraeota bacterium]|jgi:hypothetical protein|nr:Rap1a/Tai family immunity protein [Candidatus Dormibacteraeota bacterium]
MKQIGYVLFAFATSISTFGQASIDGNTLQPKCQLALATKAEASKFTSSEFMDASFCQGYVAGVLDQISGAEGTTVPDNEKFCLAKIPLSQVIKVVYKYMNEHPEQLHFDGARLIRLSLGKALPCG